MSCEPIHGIVLDEHSRRELESIRSDVRNRTWVQRILAAFGPFSVLASGTTPEVVYNVNSIEWEDVGRGIRDVNTITKAEIKRRAEYNMLGYRFKNDAQSRKHVQFWQGIATQCDPFHGPKSGKTYF